jgi:hypothetical protein
MPSSTAKRPFVLVKRRLECLPQLIRVWEREGGGRRGRREGWQDGGRMREEREGRREKREEGRKKRRRTHHPSR